MSEPGSCRDSAAGSVGSTGTATYMTTMASLPAQALRRADSTRRAIQTMHTMPEVGLVGLIRSLRVNGTVPLPVGADPGMRLCSGSVTDTEISAAEVRLAGGEVASTPRSSSHASTAAALTPHQQRWCQRIGLTKAATVAWAAHADHPASTAVLFAAASILGAATSVIEYGVGTDELYLRCLVGAMAAITVALVAAYWTFGPAYFKTKLGMSHVVMQLLLVMATELPVPFRSLRDIPFQNRMIFLVWSIQIQSLC